MNRMPSLKSIHVFLRAADLLSLSKAAVELNMTQSAASQQVKQLEELTGFVLFDRHRRGMSLSTDGKRFYDMMLPAFQELQFSFRSFLGENPRRIIRVSVETSLLTTRIIPQLGQLRDLCPDVCFVLISDEKRTGADLDHRSVAIELTSNPPGGALRSQPLIGENEDRVFVVCAPELLRRRSIKSPRDLNNQVLLTTAVVDRGGLRTDWDVWQKSIGMSEAITGERISVSNQVLALEAAANGQGFALARQIVAEPYFVSGRLMRLKLASIRPLEQYYFVSRRGGTVRRELDCLMTWLRKLLTPLAMPPGMEASEFALSLRCRPFVVRSQPQRG